MIHSFTVVPMKEEHIPAIARLEQLCFSEPWSEQGLLAELNNKTAYFYTALTPQGEVLGYAGAHLVLDEGYIANIAVFPPYRGQGIAQTLIKALQRLGDFQPLSFLTLEVRESNLPAIGLYKKMGFEAVGLRKNFYSRPTENALIMTWNNKGDTL